MPKSEPQDDGMPVRALGGGMTACEVLPGEAPVEPMFSDVARDGIRLGYVWLVCRDRARPRRANARLLYDGE